MLTYALKRLLTLPLVLLGAALLVFLLMHLAPGDTATALLGEFGQGASAEQLARLREQLGLNDPLLVQYGRFVLEAVQGDLGESLRSGRPVLEEILERFPYTLQLTLVALVLAVVVAIPAGILAARRPGSLWDTLVMGTALLGVSVPSFWLGLMLMLLFSLQLGWLPASGSGSLAHLVLPAVTIAAGSVAFIARMTRASLLEVLSQDFVRTARAKGLPEGRVVMRHALRAALIPVVTSVGLEFGGLLGGAVLTETIFAWPGLGRMTVQAILARDIYLVQGAVLFVTVTFTLVNLLTDLLYVRLNPRIRYD
ncbi:ABC-type dipeptide/oligopeptide/nickel transport system permease component [Deinobacterium chartae]|uniref:ABC-type dipeptide/oligopeptide/nickel transport system permease component n=1 Tax=Deinobacterium chartae TaxID=521158 RepID=A0A841HWJ9_9DEIO|nr:nickel ABC transporter permease [Deinobacterium chartae]MBB6097296.1 ABC-type dipeptide/oligopeptide/nickel transport system permease component [Deinobacterium chartae]